MTTETQLRTRLTAYAERLTPSGPDFAGAETAARRQRRTRTAGGAALAVLLVAVAGLGVAGLTTARHHGASPTLRGQNAESPLPGLPAIGSVEIPAGLQTQEASTEGGQVWALLSGRTSASPQVLAHGVSGGRLTQVPRSTTTPLDSNSTVLVDGPIAFVVTTKDLSNGNPTSSSLTTYDAQTGALLHREAFGPGTSADLISVTGAATLQHALVVVDPLQDGAASLRVAEISAAGALDASAAVPVPAADWDALPGSVPQASSVSVVRDEARTPRYAYLRNGYSAVPRVDLMSGAVQQISIAPASPQSCCLGGAIGEVGGRMLYDTTTGLFAGPPDSLAPVRVGFTGESTSVVDGRAYFSRQPLAQTEQELDPASLQPVGPIARLEHGQGPILLLDDGEIAATQGAARDGSGGTLFFYGAAVG